MSKPPIPEEIPTYLEWADTLPETYGLKQVLVEFFDACRVARDVFEVNVAAGVAYNRLKGLE